MVLGPSVLQRLAVGGWRLAVGGVRRLAIGDGWRRLVVGGWQRFAVDGWWRLAVGSGWRLAVGGWQRLAVGGWRLAAVGGWWSLGAILDNKKSGSLRTALRLTRQGQPETCHPQRWWRLIVRGGGYGMVCPTVSGVAGGPLPHAPRV